MLPMKTGLPTRALRIVPYLTPEEVRRLCGGCRGLGPAGFRGSRVFWPG